MRITKEKIKKLFKLGTKFRYEFKRNSSADSYDDVFTVIGIVSDNATFKVKGESKHGLGAEYLNIFDGDYKYNLIGNKLYVKNELYNITITFLKQKIINLKI